MVGRIPQELPCCRLRRSDQCGLKTRRSLASFFIEWQKSAWKQDTRSVAGAAASLSRVALRPAASGLDVVPHEMTHNVTGVSRRSLTLPVFRGRDRNCGRVLPLGEVTVDWPRRLPFIRRRNRTLQSRRCLSGCQEPDPGGFKINTGDNTPPPPPPF